MGSPFAKYAILTCIFELKENDGTIHKVAEYNLPPKQAMVAYVEQSINKNFNTFTYPNTIKGIRQSPTVPDHWYYDDIRGGRVIAAYPM